MRRDRSNKLLARGLALIPGAVNSPVRAFQAVGGDPVFMCRGEGPYIHDVDGNRYIDYVCSWGPLILGHAPADIVQAITAAAREGTSFGAATPKEIELADKVVRAVPSVDKVRFVNSGTEATMSALRLARGHTKRDRLIKFAGCYHGHADAFLADAGSGVATLGIPGSAGVPRGAVQDTLTLPYNDLDAVSDAFAAVGSDIAAVIVEPVACNMGLVLPQPGFLSGLRELCTRYGALLVFDEVITGFRLGLGGAQALFNVTPDLTTFGKIIGGGLPVGAYGGRAEIMDEVAPLGQIYQAGTLSGNPLAMAAGVAMLDALSQPAIYENLESRSASLQQSLTEVLAAHGRVARLERLGSIFHLWFKADADAAAVNYEDIKQADTALFSRFFRALLEQGVSIAPSAFEVGFVSAAHDQAHIDATLTAVDRALETVLRGSSHA